MHNILRDRVHQASVNAGWWTNLATGESILETRNRPEMMLLTVSELCEAIEDPWSADSHLPDELSLHTEIADAAIRTLDQAGGDGIDLDLIPDPEVLALALADYWFEELVVIIGSKALEAYRKGRTEQYHQAMNLFYHKLFEVADFYGFDLMPVIEKKLAYNAQRADHKVENRLAEGGKKI